MKTLKIMPLLMGVIVAAAIGVTPLAAMAQERQSPPQRGADIVLSQEQQTKFAQLRTETIAQIEKVLTPTQMTQFKNSGPSGIKGLSQEQKTKLQQIFESYLGSIRAILTKEQLQQLEQAQPKQ